MFYNKSKNLFFLQSLVTYSLNLILASLSHWREPIYLIANDYLTTWTPPYDSLQWCLFATVEKNVEISTAVHIIRITYVIYVYSSSQLQRQSKNSRAQAKGNNFENNKGYILYKSNKPVMALHRKQARWYYNYIAKSN